MEKPGYTALLMGEVVNLVKCKPVYVTVDKVNTCYMELPVNYSGKLYFMTPKSHILQKTGTPLTCTMFMQPSYHLEGKWFASSTQMILTKEPPMMAIDMKPTWSYTDAGDLAKAGIYDESDLSRLRSQIMYPSERKAISQTISAAINEDSVVVNTLMYSYKQVSRIIDVPSLVYPDPLAKVFQPPPSQAANVSATGGMGLPETQETVLPKAPVQGPETPAATEVPTPPSAAAPASGTPAGTNPPPQKPPEGQEETKTQA